MIDRMDMAPPPRSELPPTEEELQPPPVDYSSWVQEGQQMPHSTILSQARRPPQLCQGPPTMLHAPPTACLAPGSNSLNIPARNEQQLPLSEITQHPNSCVLAPTPIQSRPPPPGLDQPPPSMLQATPNNRLALTKVSSKRTRKANTARGMSLVITDLGPPVIGSTNSTQNLPNTHLQNVDPQLLDPVVDLLHRTVSVKQKRKKQRTGRTAPSTEDPPSLHVNDIHVESLSPLRFSQLFQNDSQGFNFDTTFIQAINDMNL